MALILRSAVAHQTISPGLYKVVEKFLVCDMKAYKGIPIWGNYSQMHRFFESLDASKFLHLLRITL